jgi:ketosteroid isomerase-like protein
MSRENVEVVRLLYNAFNRGDVEASLALIDPQIQVEYWGERLDPDQSYHGHAGLREFVDQLRDSFPDYRAEIEECIDAGDDVVIVIRNRGTGKTSGLEVDVRSCQVWTVRAGKLTRMRVYRSKTDALDALGLRE